MFHGAVILLAAGSAGGYLVTELALGVAVALAATLAAGVAVAVTRGVRAPCACFGGQAARPLGAAHVIRNIGLLTLLAAGLAAGWLQSGRPRLAGTILAAAAGLVVSLLVARWDDLVSLFAPVTPARTMMSAPAGRPGYPDKPAD